MFGPVLAALTCPVCGVDLHAAASGLRCSAGHAFDAARQGYVNLLAGLGRAGLGADDADAVAARVEFLTAGHFSPVAEGLAKAGVDLWPGAGLVLDAGAGPGYYLAAVLDALSEAHGLAIDSSTAALRRAAKVHPRACAIGWDLREPLPLHAGSAGLVLNVFAPRNAQEYARVLRSDGSLLVVTPAADHLAEAISPLGLIRIDADKAARLAASLEPWFAPIGAEAVRYRLTLNRAGVRTLVLMGPNAHHVFPLELERRLAELPDPIEVTVAVQIARYRPLSAVA
ncbi:MAG: putative RNA methyltransferase [Sporichthyaceae bacterium]